MGGHEDEVRRVVREHYGKVAKGGAGCAPACCGAIPAPEPGRLGYSPEEAAAVPEGTDLGLGCGNPSALAGLAPGDRVLDLGSGPGFDALLAAQAVGPKGRVVGVDMTPAMIERSRENAARAGLANVEFRLGEIEHLPVADAGFDVVLSNCVVNLSPDKRAVYREAFRALRPGGRLAISDTLALAPLPEHLREPVEAWTGCVAGAMRADELVALLREVGFEEVTVEVSEASRRIVAAWLPGSGIEDYLGAASITARRPGVEACCQPSCCTGEGAT